MNLQYVNQDHKPHEKECPFFHLIACTKLLHHHEVFGFTPLPIGLCNTEADVQKIWREMQ